MKIIKKQAKSISYGNKRSLKDIKYIVIHYTGNTCDTAKGNLNYFATGNTRTAGAHFFVDKEGIIGKSINMNRVAWSVGGSYGLKNGAGAYYKKCTNANSVSIELCDMCVKTNWEQMLATRKLITYIRSKCPNANTIIRHWDVNGKVCPAPFVGKSNDKWTLFYRFITTGYTFDAMVTKSAALRKSPKVTATNKKASAKLGDVIKIIEVRENWGRVKGKDLWITLDKVKEI